MTPEERKAKLANYRAQASAAADLFAAKQIEKKETDELEICELLGPSYKIDFIVIECKDAAPELPQFVVYNRPTGPQTDRFKAQLWKDSKEKGAVEAKSRAGAELARQCLKWPSPELYEQLLDANRMFADKAAGFLIEEVQAGADLAGKG